MEKISRQSSLIKPEKSVYPSPILMRAVRGLGFFFSKLIWGIEFKGLENIPQNSDGGLVIAANHATYLDAGWVIIPVNRRFRFMAWDKAFTWFGIGSIIKYLGAFPVNIEKGDQAAYQQAVEVLREGATLVIFPEGSREFADGKLLDFKSGAVRMAIESEVPILPVTLRGVNKVWARGMKYPRPFRKITVVYHPLYHPAPPPETAELREHARELTKELKSIIEKEL